MSGEPARALDPDAAEDERHFILERVRVEARTDSKLAHTLTGSARC
jgi:hypothetical protein